MVLLCVFDGKESKDIKDTVPAHDGLNFSGRDK